MPWQPNLQTPHIAETAWLVGAVWVIGTYLSTKEYFVLRSFAGTRIVIHAHNHAVDVMSMIVRITQ